VRSKHVVDSNQRFEEYLERENRLREVDEALRMKSVAGLITTYQCKRVLRKQREILVTSSLEVNG